MLNIGIIDTINIFSIQSSKRKMKIYYNLRLKNEPADIKIF